MIADTVEGHITPTMALAKPPIIPLVNMQFTARGLARELMEQLSALEGAAELTEPGTSPAPVESWSSGRSSRTEVISSSLAFGFPWADILHVGMAFVVCTDDDPVAAQRIADRLAAEAWERRAEFVCPLATPSEAVDEAITLHAAEGGPVVLPDMSDNPGGGGTSDGVVVLQELIARSVQNCVVATIVDPDVVQSAHTAGMCLYVPRVMPWLEACFDDCFDANHTGVGGKISGMLGGKMDGLHGPSLPFTDALVVSLDDEGHFVCSGPMMTGTQFYMGRTAVLLVAGKELF